MEMGMFVVVKGTKYIKVTYKGLDYSKKKMITKIDMVFGKEELLIDPTGISKYASVPSHMKTVGGYWAQQGYYGFKVKDGIYLIPNKDVKYA